MTSNKIMSGSAIFPPIVIDNRGVSHPYSCLREGYISFRHLDKVLACTKKTKKQQQKTNKQTKQAKRQQQEDPVSVTDVFRHWSGMSYATNNQQQQQQASFHTEQFCWLKPYSSTRPLHPVCSSAANRLVGLVVKVSASRAEDPGFESRLRRDFSGVESYR